MLPRLLTTDKLSFKQFDAAIVDGATDFATRRLDIENSLRLVREGGRVLVSLTSDEKTQSSLRNWIAFLQAEGVCSPVEDIGEFKDA